MEQGVVGPYGQPYGSGPGYYQQQGIAAPYPEYPPQTPSPYPQQSTQQRPQVEQLSDPQPRIRPLPPGPPEDERTPSLPPRVEIEKPQDAEDGDSEGEVAQGGSPQESLTEHEDTSDGTFDQTTTSPTEPEKQSKDRSSEKGGLDALFAPLQEEQSG